MKLNVFWASLLCLLLVTSCGKEEKDDFVDLHSMPAVPMEGELIDGDWMGYHTDNMRFIQSKLFHFCPTKEDACLVTTEKMDTIGYLSGIGNGPGEMLQPSFCGVSENQDTIYMYDDMVKEQFVFHVEVEGDKMSYMFVEKRKLNSSSLQYRGMNMFQQYFFLTRLGNGYSVAYRCLTNGDIFTLFDKDLNALADFGEYPIDKNLFEGEVHNTLGFGGPMAADETSFYFASYHFGYLSRYDVNDQGNLSKIWEKQFTSPKYSVRNNLVKISSDNVESFYDLIVGKEYIYVSFSGMEERELFNDSSGEALIPKMLVVLDKQGNVKGKFDLGKKICTFCLDDKEEYLYVNHEEPDASMWRYKVSDFMENF